MMMLFCAIGIIAIFGFLGYRKGLINIALSFVSVIVTVVAGLIFAPVISSFLCEKTEIDESISNAIYEQFEKNESIDNLFDSSFKTEISINRDVYDEYKSEIEEKIKEVSEKINLPENLLPVKEKAENDEGDILDTFEDFNGKTLKGMVLKVCADRISGVAIIAVTYVVVMIVVMIVLKFIISATGIIGRLPVIKQANKLGGIAVGIAEGVIIVWIAFIILTAMANMEFARNCLSEINENVFLNQLYKNNLIVNILFK